MPPPNPLDQSQRAAEPTETLSAGELLARLQKEAAPKEDDSEEALFNRQRAHRETALIFELKDSPAFEWFFDEFVAGPFREARRDLHDEHTTDLTKAQTVYITLKKVRVALIEREIAHREQLDSTDHEIVRLREILSGL